ncbi:hypothetical protein RhiirA5_405764 [Rhizophagus irregularis]|uniref:Uncharacterized protein n=1 Tax=Rhizophagus irregularis TaxID=588596 RepID=A0A2N0QEJ8_9GLOM|nr:hypothetical protein RhiirA5_405764 [Rhizophagus irregularis]PKC64520.1 hypothetical protein RhiirA1_462312 [Rhizophagus irregularis]GET65384.1 hypothetical protein RIR_jg5421.t1 [Rhizophagus irregularis DAOM 181602=DAOM 197198]
MFECQLDLVNKEISVMNKIYEGEIGLIEGKLNLINKINKEIKLFDGKHYSEQVDLSQVKGKLYLTQKNQVDLS